MSTPVFHILLGLSCSTVSSTPLPTLLLSENSPIDSKSPNQTARHHPHPFSLLGPTPGLSVPKLCPTTPSTLPCPLLSFTAPAPSSGPIISHLSSLLPGLEFSFSLSSFSQFPFQALCVCRTLWEPKTPSLTISAVFLSHSHTFLWTHSAVPQVSTTINSLVSTKSVS